MHCVCFTSAPQCHRDRPWFKDLMPPARGLWTLPLHDPLRQGSRHATAKKTQQSHAQDKEQDLAPLNASPPIYDLTFSLSTSDFGAHGRRANSLGTIPNPRDQRSYLKIKKDPRPKIIPALGICETQMVVHDHS